MSLRISTPIVLLALGLAACAPPAEPEAVRNAFLISLDTLRSDRVGTYGYERDTTPFLDEIAASSLVFEQAYSTSAWTLTSHASMLSGVEPEIHGLVNPRVGFAQSLPLLAERLQAIGVQTHATYYQGWISELRGFQRGFDYFKPSWNAEHAGARIGEILEMHDPEVPSFTFVHLFDIHSAPFKKNEMGPVYNPPAPYDDMFLPGARAQFANSNPARVWDEVEPLSAEQVVALNALYDGGIRYVDSKLQEWWQEWEQAGLLDNSMVLITSDHGEGLGGRDGSIKNHGGFWQEGLHVPMILHRTNGSVAPARIEAQVSILDATPTIMAFLGVDPDPRLNGVDLFGAIPEGRVVGAKQNEYTARIRGGSKLVRNALAAILFDIEKDPGELSPIANEGEALNQVGGPLEADFESQIEGFGEIPEPRSITRSEYEKNQLEALGYKD